MALPTRLIAKIAILLGLVAFFFPFVTVSCNASYGDTKMVLGTGSGFDMMIGNLKEDPDSGAGDSMFSSSTESNGEEENVAKGINFWMLLAFLAGGAALMLLFISEKKYLDKEHICAILSGAAALLVIIGRITFRSFTKIDEMASQNQSGGDFINTGNIADMITIETRWGLIVCVTMFVIGAAACFLTYKNGDETYLPFELVRR